MLPREIIEQLAGTPLGKEGRVILTQPITNIPTSDSDYQAGKLMQYIIDTVMQDESKLQDILLLLADVNHYYLEKQYHIEFSAGEKAVLVADYIDNEITTDKTDYLEKVIILAETQWWIVFFAAFGREAPYENVKDMKNVCD